MWTSGCATTVSNACPNLKEYSASIQDAAAAEEDALPDGSVIKDIYMPDYGTMRDGVRACRAARK